MKKNILMCSVLFMQCAYAREADSLAKDRFKERVAQLTARKQAIYKAQQERKVQRLALLKEHEAKKAQKLAQKECEKEALAQRETMRIAQRQKARSQAEQEREAQRQVKLAQYERERKEREEARVAYRAQQEKRAQELMLARQEEQQQRQLKKAEQLALREKERVERAQAQALLLAQREKEKQELQLAQAQEKKRALEQRELELAQQKASRAEQEMAREAVIIAQKVEKESVAPLVVATQEKPKKAIVVQELPYKEPLASLMQDIAGSSMYNDRFNKVMAYAEKNLEVTRELVHAQQRMVDTMRKDLAQLTHLALGTSMELPEVASQVPGEKEFNYAFDQFAYHAHANREVIQALLQVLDGECTIVSKLEKNTRGSQLEKVIAERNDLLEKSPIAVQRFYEKVMEQAFDVNEQFEGNRSEYLQHMRQSLNDVQEKVKTLQQNA